MSDNNNDFAHELEVEEKKHKKVVEYDLVIFGVLIIVFAFAAVSTLVLKSAYKPVKDVKYSVAQALQQCNKSILTAAETYRKNTTDMAARDRVDAGKTAFDAAVSYYGGVAKKGTGEGVMLAAVDSCYRCGARFRDTLEVQRNLIDAGLSADMLNGMEKDLNRLKEKRDSLLAGIEAYNSNGFFLKLSWITPYSGKIEYTSGALPELQPIAPSSPPQETKDKKVKGRR